jgi:hypothetical protein
MTWSAFVLAVLKALPALISLVSALKNDADAATNRGLGYDQAVADGLKRAADMLAIAHQVEDEAQRDHASKSDDSAFDRDFQRKD